MRASMRTAAVSTLLMAALSTQPSIAVSAPLTAATQMRDTASASAGTIEQIQYRGRGGYRGGYHRGRGWGGYGIGAGILGGAVVGSLLANRYYGPRYYEGRSYYYSAPRTIYAEPDVDGDSVAYCQSRFRSYDPSTGTYLGYDGYRHACP